MTLREKIESRLKDDEFVFDPAEMATASILEMTAKGIYPVCWRCGTRLEFALSPAEAKRKSVAPGVRCLENLNHCEIVVEFADSP